jgi:radical SAM superfamily enzyme YgiQ (UPF0313 family)
MAAYHLLPMSKYYPAVGSYKRLPAVSMVTSRGCPGKCTFCYQPYGSLQRQRSPKKIFEEVMYLVKNYGIREISFYDDNFTTQKPRVREFCQMLIDNKVDLTWSCFSRVDWADLNLLKIMKQAGCHQIMYGIESGDQRILDTIRKETTPEKIKRAAKWTKEVGIDVRATFMLGNPGETEETMRNTIDFAIELDPEYVVFNVPSPNPGTQMYDWAVKSGVLREQKWEEFDLTTPTLQLDSVSQEKVQEYYKLAYRRFYLRPSFMFKRLLRIRNLNDIRNLFAGLKAVLNVTQSKAPAPAPRTATPLPKGEPLKKTAAQS